MTKLSLLALVMLGVSMAVSANSDQSQDLGQSEAVQVTGTSDATQGANNAVRLKFMSRRAYQNPAVKNKKRSQAERDSAMQEREEKARKRLNRQFKSKRPYMNYQFD